MTERQTGKTYFRELCFYAIPVYISDEISNKNFNVDYFHVKKLHVRLKGRISRKLLTYYCNLVLCLLSGRLLLICQTYYKIIIKKFILNILYHKFIEQSWRFFPETMFLHVLWHGESDNIKTSVPRTS